MSAEFEVTITDKDMFRFNIYHAYHGFQGILATLVGVWVLIMAVITFSKVNIFYTILYVVLGIVFLIYVPGNLYLRSKKQISSSDVLKNALRYKIDDAGVHVSQGEQAADLEWKQIYKMVSTKNQLLIYSTRVNAYIIPKEAIEEQYETILGLAIALVTVLLYKDRDKQEHHIFWVGVFLGGAYEYICSVFTEILFGKVFWDYSAMPFNLGGRINLLYCFFWGIAAVVWIKGIYPKAARLIDIILKKTGWVLTGILLVFMAFNIFVSVLALVRYDTRSDGKAAVYRWEQAMDEHFDDVKMEQIYPNAIRQ